MNIETYLIESARTASPSFYCTTQNDINLLHAIIGMVTEVAELENYTDEVNLGEELGDMMWYLALAYRAIDVKPFDKDVSEMMSTVANIQIQFQVKVLDKELKDLLDKMKKKIFYNKPIVDLQTKLDYVWVCIQLIANAALLNIEDVMERNINKLKVRYPEKFTERNAISRNLGDEYAALGKR